MAPEYSVEELLALDGVAFVEFIKANRDRLPFADEVLDITNIKDWHNVSENQRTEFLQRLIEAYPIVKGPQLSDFFPQLLAKLEGVQSEGRPSRKSPPTSPEASSKSLSPEPPGAAKRYEIRCYHELVKDGGRPPCSLDTLDQIYQSPSCFKELLGPWLRIPLPRDPDDWGVFSFPLERWKEFRRWQRVNRVSNSSMAGESLSDFMKEKRLPFEMQGQAAWTRTPEYEEAIRSWWEEDQATGQWKRIREVKGGSFTEYVKAARRRLAKHGFHEAFQLLKDPQRQNERATWIEYLEFECWWLDANARTVQRRKPSHDAAWEELVRSGVLRAGEREEDLLAPLIGGLDHQCTPREEAILRFQGKANAYHNAKAIESRQSLRVQWALNQVPQKLAARKPAARAGKRRLEKDAEILDEAVEQRPAAKQQRIEPEQEPDGGASRRKKATTSWQRNASKTAGLLSLAGPAWEVKEGKRRSTRIKNSKDRGKGDNRLLGVLRELP